MEKQFATGLYYELPNEKAPEWVKGKISVKVSEFIPFLEAHVNGGGYVNLDVLEAKSGKLYVVLNEYKKGTLKDPSRKMTEDEIAAAVPPIDLDAEPEQPVDDIPF